MEQMTKKDGQTMDIVADNIEQLKTIFPEVFSEDKIDFERLQSLLGEYVNKDEEHYNFTWHGKKKAQMIAQTPSTGTGRQEPGADVVLLQPELQRGHVRWRFRDVGAQLAGEGNRSRSRGTGAGNRRRATHQRAHRLPPLRPLDAALTAGVAVLLFPQGGRRLEDDDPPGQHLPSGAGAGHRRRRVQAAGSLDRWPRQPQ